MANVEKLERYLTKYFHNQRQIDYDSLTDSNIQRLRHYRKTLNCPSLSFLLGLCNRRLVYHKRVHQKMEKWGLSKDKPIVYKNLSDSQKKQLRRLSALNGYGNNPTMLKELGYQIAKGGGFRED